MAYSGTNNSDLKNKLQTQPQNQGVSFQAMMQQEFKKIFPAIQSMVPKHMTPERLMRVSLAAISRAPTLAKCAPESIIGAVTACAVMGLEPNLIGHAYLVPFWNSKIKCYECQFQIGYKGYIDLCRRSGGVSKIDAIPVYENDLVVYIQGTESRIVHIPFAMVHNLNENMFNNSDSIIHNIIRGALIDWKKRSPTSQGNVNSFYSYYELKDGGKGFKVMTLPEIEEHRDRFTKSRDKDTKEITGPWKDHFEAMALKTCVKQMVKFMPMTIEVQEQISKDEGVVTINTNSTGMNDVDLFNVDYSVLPANEENSEKVPNGTDKTPDNTDEVASFLKT